jgi:TPP-dependent pyruvate/acetoin dehydrogenase alpha subunit
MEGMYMKLSNEDLVKLYGDMWFIRHFEQRVQELFAGGALPGFIHLGLGQEACMAGTCFNLEDGDIIGATHREHGVLLLRGVSANAIMAELYGKVTGTCKGKGGSMHACGLAEGALGNNAILGPGQTIINGFAYAHKFKKNKKVAVSMFGDGASNRGEFHEGLNFASVWNLPTIFIINNNGYAISVPVSKQQKIHDLSARAAGYGIPGVSIDGNDVLTVVETVAEAVKRAREGAGPSLIEFKTYRWRGHFEGDPTPYRTSEELQDWMDNRDPIKNFGKALLEREVLTEKEMEEISAEKLAIVDAAQKFSEDSEWPPESEIYTDVYYHDEGGVRQ